MLKRTIALAALMAVASTGTRAADVQPVSDFYKGKIIKFVMSAGEGGGYGTYVNAIIPYMQKCPSSEHLAQHLGWISGA